MKKRILSCLMALALCLTLLPTAALATEAEGAEHKHPICGTTCPGHIVDGKNDTHESVEWTAINDAAGLERAQADGYYYLTKDVELSGSWNPPNNITLDLNGKTITVEAESDKIITAINVIDVAFTLTDCKGTGKITHKQGGGKGGGVYVSGGEFTMYGGEISGGNTAEKGGGVYVVSGGTFNLYDGGTISGNTAESTGQYKVGTSGGVYVNGKFEMSGGTISANTADSTDGGVGVYSGTFTMSGGKITGNGATKGGGVGVYHTATFEMSGTASITDNTANQGGGVYVKVTGVGVNSGKFEMNGTSSVKGNTATNNGGGVYVESGKFEMNYSASVSSNKASSNKADQGNGGGVYVKSGTFEMNGSASVSSNTATNTQKGEPTYGGGVGVYGGTFTMNGKASVSSNEATNGGGVYASIGTFNMNGETSIKSNIGNGVFVNGGTFTVAGAPTVTENTMNEDASNVFLAGSKTITIGGKLNEGASIGVDTNLVPAEGKPIVVAEGSKKSGSSYTVQESDAKAFFSDHRTYQHIELLDGSVKLCYGAAHTPTPEHNHIWAYTLSSDHKTITATCTNTMGNCDVNKDGGSVTITAPEHKTYGDDKSAEAQLTKANWRGNDDNVEKITYSTQGGTLLNAAPTEVGKYKASITVGGKTAFVEYEITGETPPPALVTQITLNPTTATLKVGDTKTLTVTVTPNQALTWESSAPQIATVENGKVTAKAAGTATITVKATDSSNVSATCAVTVTADTTTGGGSTGGGSSSGGSGSSSSGGGSSSSDRDSYDSNPIIKTETKNNPDGSTTKTETRKDGSVTQTTTGKDGSTSKTETKKDGSSVTENKAADGSTGTVKTDKNGQIEAKTALSNKAIEAAKKNGEAVKAPLEVEASRNSNTAPTVKVELPKNAGETEVEIPVSNAKPGTVAVLVHPDGTEEILKNSVPTEGGIRLTVDGSATVKIVDNSKGFIDIRNHWAEDEIDFVSARGLVNGVSDTIYAPNNSTTRAQLWTILARQNDANLNGGNTWYEKAQNWAKSEGVSDGTDPNADINRAQMVTMLWRAVGQPAASRTASFIDVPADAYYAGAVSWAVENGITVGVGGGRFDPNGTCTRAQVAAFLARHMK